MESKLVDQSNPWAVLFQEVKFECPYFDARHDLVSFAGASARAYDSIRVKAHGVCVAPIDHDGSVTLVGQYRYVLDRYTWELPGGGVALGVEPLDAARAELAEETGLEARQWLKMAEGAASIGTSDEVVRGYVAWDLRHGQPRPDPEERLSLRRVSFSEALSLALNGKIENLIGTTLLLAIEVHRRHGRLPKRLAELLKHNQ